MCDFNQVGKFFGVFLLCRGELKAALEDQSSPCLISPMSAPKLPIVLDFPLLCLNASFYASARFPVISIPSKSDQALISHLAWWTPTQGNTEKRHVPLCLSLFVRACMTLPIRACPCAAEGHKLSILVFNPFVWIKYTVSFWVLSTPSCF